MKQLSLLLSLITVSLALSAGNAPSFADLKTGWEHPSRSYKSHTRWWWPGNAVNKAEITWQLEQMAEQGFGGVEIMSAWRMYEKGNTDYLSEEFLEKMKHAVAEGKRLDMDVAITFSPGWSFGGPWVKKEDQSKVLLMASQVLDGGTDFTGKLPVPEIEANQHSVHASKTPEKLEAVVAARVAGKNKLDGETLVDLTGMVDQTTGALNWNVPAGKWRLMSFWLAYTGQTCQAQNEDPPSMVIDHMDKGAVERYCNYLGNIFYELVGEDFGTTVDSFFCDSFEIHPLPGSLLWSWETTAGFKDHAGYDLTPYLPAIWFDIGPDTGRIRYDLQNYLHEQGLDALYETYGDWCRQHNIQDRIQPHYRFTPEIVQSAGSISRPETEVTTARFEPVADPRKATVSGAAFYGDKFVSAESYTFIHPARYRTDLMDLKIATDAFLRDGISQFYNHGYFASPEKHVAPGRDMPWANRISHWNTWWEHYNHFADYVARSCYLLRQGDLVADVLIYSPQATAWSENALWGTNRRVMRYGNLAKTLVANGYDFDILNDDLMQNQAIFKNGRITINGLTRRVIILPEATVFPIESMRQIEAFVEDGGTVIALGKLPARAAGLNDFKNKDKELNQIVKRVFSMNPGRKGKGIFIPGYEIDRKPFNPQRKPPEPTAPLTVDQRTLLKELNSVVVRDFALAGNLQSDGLTHIHKKIGKLDVYFVTNLQPKAISTEVTFRVESKTVQRWDAITGSRTAVTNFQPKGSRTSIPVDFEPWESAFFVFGADDSFISGEVMPEATETVLVLSSPWELVMEGYRFDKLEKNVPALYSWTLDADTRNFSGTAVYQTRFDFPAGAFNKDKPYILDLGKLGNMAEVELNGIPCGFAWMAPYKIDVGKALKPGRNELIIKVTNTLINYVASLDEVPPVPEELKDRFGGTNPLLSHERAYRNPPREFKTSDLPPSGLMGPVMIMTSN